LEKRFKNCAPNRRRWHRDDEGFADDRVREAAEAQTNFAGGVGRMRGEIGVVPGCKDFRGE
jgi:hypothetical protein